MRNRVLFAWLLAASFVAWPLLALPQSGDQNRTLTVNGQSGRAPVIEADGHTYVDLEALARIANGSLALGGDQIVLIIPDSAAKPSADSAAEPPADSAAEPSADSAAEPSTDSEAEQPPADSAFSKSFMRAAIQELSVIREWRNSLKNAIDRSYPISDDWRSLYRGQAVDGLQRASVEATNDADRSALRLLTNEFNNMEALADKYLEKIEAVEYTPPDALKNDPMNQEILTCARSLASMISNGQFIGDGSCR
jgi:hypothetical protein